MVTEGTKKLIFSSNLSVKNIIDHSCFSSLKIKTILSNENKKRREHEVSKKSEKGQLTAILSRLIILPDPVGYSTCNVSP
jgi:hypothetical protein